MRHLYPVILATLFIAKLTYAETVSVDASANRHAIDPRIYGVAFATTAQLTDLNCPLNRQGGNTTTRYNWQLNASNHANDWYYESLAETSAVAGELGDTFISNTKAAGADSMLTIPMIGWVAKLGASRGRLASFSQAKYGAQTGNDWQWFPDAGNGILSSNNQNVTGNDPNDANVASDSTFQQSWMQHLVGTWGTAGNGGLRYYILDNEHSIWQGTHRDVHPTGATMDEIKTKMIDYATKVKSTDPNALVVGPEEWGWDGYLYSGYDQQQAAANGWSNFPDRNNHGGWDYLPWILDQLRQNQASTGKRLLDVFSVHYYPQSGEFGNDTSTAMQQLRNKSTRSLWDPNYVDVSWIGTQVQLIPRIKNWVASYYPGTQTAITEYNWGAEANINGATTQADIFGIFGREGLDLGTRWTTPDPSTPTYKAMQLYRNYDGSKATFGDASVKASVTNPDILSSFAAVRSSDGAMTVMVINKDLSNSSAVSVTLANFNAGSSSQVWQLTSANQINHLGNIAVAANSVSLTVPAQSITLLVIPVVTVAIPAAPTALSATAASSTQINLSWTDTASDHTGFKLERKTGSGGTYAQIATPAASASSYSDSALSASTQYYYRIRAANSVGDSSYSNEANATTQTPPAITNGPPPNGTPGSAYNFSYTATGNPAPTFSVTAGSLPPGLSISSAGSISGTPNASGSYNGTVTAANGANPVATQNFNIAINNPAPTLASIAPVSATAGGAAFTLTLNGTNFIAGSVVQWSGQANLNPATQSATKITVNVPASYIAATGTPGVTVVNPAPGGGTTAAQTFTINGATTQTAPAIANGPAPNGTLGSAYNFSYTATGNPAPAFSVTAGSLPPGLAITSSGIISGTPTTAGTFSGTVTASSSVNPAATQNFSIIIAASSGTTPPQFTSPATATLSTASVNQTISFSAAASDPNGGTVTLTWSFGDGATASGSNVSHAYSVAGSYTVTATASSNSGTASSSIAIAVVDSVGQTPVITSPLTASATQGSVFSYQIAATGTAPISFQAQNLPAGLSLSGTAITGTPATAGSIPVTLTATNSLGTDSETLLLNIAVPAGAPNDPPVFSSPPTADSSTGTVGESVTFSVAAADPAGNPLSYTWNFGDGTSAQGANVSHVYSAPGIYTETVTVGDGTSTATSSMNFVVSAVDTTGSGIAGDGWDVGPLNAFKILKGVMKFNFAGESRDSLMCSGTIPVLKYFKPGGMTVTVLIGGLEKAFTLNARGQGTATDGASKFQMRGKMNKGVFMATPAKFSLNIRGEPLLNAVAQYGFGNVNTIKAGEHHAMPVIVMLDQTGYENVPSMMYKARAGKSGTATVLGK